MAQLDETRSALIREALGNMNHVDNEEWNEDGSPKIGVVRGYAQDTSITEDEVRLAAPGFRYTPPSPEELAAAQHEADAEADEVETDKDDVEEKVRADGVSCIDFSKIPPDRLDELKEYRARLEALVAEQGAIRDAAIQRGKELSYELDALCARIAQIARPLEHTNEVRRFLDKQKEVKQAALRRTAQIEGALGIRLPTHATPLDAAQANGFSPYGGSKKRSHHGPQLNSGVLDIGRVNMALGMGHEVK